jgi:hypothetical protein
MIQLTSRGAVVTAGDATLGAVAAEFARSRCVILPGLIDPALLSRIQFDIDRSALYERRHGSIASELCMPENACLGLLHFLVNDPQLFRVIERITSVTRITAFHGRVYRRLPGEHFDSWHTDLHPDRAVGMSINLSDAAYDGGLFEIRDQDSDHVFASVANTGPGDALLFAIADGLEHQVTRVAGSRPKTAFAGWFGGITDYVAALRRDPALTEAQ